MMHMIAYVLLCLGVHLINAGIYDETLIAKGLLGSHFGRIGLPASFDYVVIGGGTAGLTVGRRLAVNASVAVIEAGDFYEFGNGNFSEVPAYASTFTGNDPSEKNPYLDWYHYTEPQPTLNDRRFLYDSGKIIGGTSGRSFLWQIRGTLGSYEKWANDVGDESYKFANFLPYFKKSYDFSPPNNNERPSNSSASYNESDWSPPGQGGPLKIGYPSWVNPISSWLGRSFQELGIQNLSSLTSGFLLGWSWLSETIDPSTQIRSSSEAFLRDALTENDNLVIYKSTLAKKIIFEDLVAKAVVVESGGVTYNISARQEIILSAGVMRSPQLLMVSGIGPRATLESQDIPVLADRPGVGQNMWDSILVGPTYSVDVTTHNSLSSPEFLEQSIETYNANRTGILTNSGGDVAAFEKLAPSSLKLNTSQSLNSAFPEDWPHVEYLVLDAYFGSGSDSTTGINNGEQYVAASVGLMATFSRGNVTIASPDTAVNPVISPNWLTDPRDQDLAIAAFRRGRALFSTDSIKPVVLSEAYPGANLTSDADILKVVKESINSVYNAVGTCKMGKANDEFAVVDSMGRVFGVQNLRLVDASAFPFLPPGQPIATVFALAEKIAEDIATS